MEDKRDIVTFEQFKKITDKLEEAGMSPESEISFEFICSSLFPLIYYKMKAEMRHQYDEGVRSALQGCEQIELNDSIQQSLRHVGKSLEAAISELSVGQRKIRTLDPELKQDAMKQLDTLQSLITIALLSCNKLTERT